MKIIKIMTKRLGFFARTTVLCCLIGILLPLYTQDTAFGFYGPAFHAEGLANLEIGKHGRIVSYRFRAEHTGAIKELLQYFVLKAPKYSAGDGGHLRVDLVSDDGSQKHLPAADIIASWVTKNPREQADIPFKISFSPGGKVEKGKLYHLVYSNPHSDPQNNYVSIDDIFNPTNTVPGLKRRQPSYDESDLAVLYKDTGNDWILNLRHIPIINIIYESGAAQGQGYMESPYVSLRMTIGGDAMARQIFTVSGVNKTVCQLALRIKKVSDNPEPLIFMITDDTGNEIALGTILPQHVPSSDYGWAACTFEDPVILEDGLEYSLIVKSDNPNSYHTYPMQNGKGYGFVTGFFDDGHAEFTESGHNGWRTPRAADRKDFDLQFFFITGRTPVMPDESFTPVKKDKPRNEKKGSRSASVPGTIYGSALGAVNCAPIGIGTPENTKVSYRFRAEYPNEIYAAVNSFLLDQGKNLAAGDGGKVLVELMTDDESPQNLPSGKVLTSRLIDDPKKELAGGQGTYRFFNYRGVFLEKGKIYHLVFSNPHSSPQNNYVSINNLIANKSAALFPNRMQPRYENTDLAVLVYNGDKWLLRSGYTPVFNLHYSDGSKQGQGYISTRIDTPDIIGGTHMVRQIFSVAELQSGIHTISVLVRRNKNIRNPLILEILSAGGEQIFTSEIKAGSVSDLHYEWVSVTLRKPITPAKGSTYHLILRSAEENAYVTYPIMKGIHEGLDSGIFKGGHYEFTHTGNTGWKTPEKNNNPVFDMQFFCLTD